MAFIQELIGVGIIRIPANPFISTTPISAGTVLWAAVYALLVLGLAVLAFRRRDL